MDLRNEHGKGVIKHKRVSVRKHMQVTSLRARSVQRELGSLGLQRAATTQHWIEVVEKVE
jgi:hypothetical protein